VTIILSFLKANASRHKPPPLRGRQCADDARPATVTAQGMVSKTEQATWGKDGQNR
jgi:hypothetical protein